jgi:hypothetical protein
VLHQVLNILLSLEVEEAETQWGEVEEVGVIAPMFLEKLQEEIQVLNQHSV